MKITTTPISELIVIEPKVFGDDRGYFMESFNAEWFNKNVSETNFIQDNESKSSKGVLRGLHFQNPPFSQAKLVRVIQGEVLDVAVDLRKDSPTYGKHHSIILSDENKKHFLCQEVLLMVLLSLVKQQYLVIKLIIYILLSMILD